METYYLAVDIGASSGKMELGWMENGKLCLEEVWRFPNGAKKKNGRRCWDTDALFSEIKAGLAAQALAPLVQPVGKHKAGRPKLRPVRQALVFRKLGHGLPQGFHVGGAFQRPVPPAGVYRQKRLPAPLRKGRILRFVHRFPSLPSRRVRRGIISHVYDLYRRRRKGSTKGYGAPAGIIDP